MLLRALNAMVVASVYLSLSFPIVELHGQPINSATDSDVWVHSEATGCPLEDQIAVGKNRVFDVNPAQRQVAIEALRQDRAVLLSSKQFKEFVKVNSLPPEAPQTKNNFSNSKPYLVRAVSASLTNRSISVQWCDQDLLVFSGSLGGGKPQKDPVVVFLEKRPRRVFLSYMAVK